MNLQSREQPGVNSALIAVDMTGTIWHWDDAAERLFGWPARLALGQWACGLLTPDRFREERVTMFAQISAGSSWLGCLPFLKSDGEEILVDVARTPLTGVTGQVVGIIGVHRRASMGNAYSWEDSHAQPATAEGNLTPREVEVARYVAQGFTNQQIGRAMEISPGVVSNYIAGIFEKLKINRRSVLAVWAVNRGFWRPD